MNITEYKNIKEQMTDMIFNSKRVKYDQRLFDEYYDRLFPVREELLNFLCTSGKDVMQSAARRIADRLLFESSFNGMQFLFANLLSFETRNLSDTGENYVPQDHVVHSVHLYLLGIYCYFNFSVFHDILFGYFSELEIKSEYSYTKQEKAFWGFWESWRTFAFLHDIAYPYESMFNAQGEYIDRGFEKILQKYKFMNEYMCYSAAMEYFSGLILLYTLMEESFYHLGQAIKEEGGKLKEKKHGICFDGSCVNKEKIWEYRKLKGFFFNEDYKKYSQYFDKDDCVILIKNKEYNIVGMVCGKDSERMLFTEPNLSWEQYDLLQRIDTLSRLELKQLGLRLEFYIPNDIDNILSKGLNKVHIRARLQYVKEICYKIRNLLSVELASVSENKSLLDIQYGIMEYLTERCPPDICIPIQTFAEVLPKNILKNKKAMLSETMLEEMRELLNEMLKESSNVLTEEEVTTALEKMQKIDLKRLSEHIEIKYYDEKEKKDTDKLNVIETFQKIFHEFIDDSERMMEEDQKVSADIYGAFSEQVGSGFREKIGTLMQKEEFISAKDDIEVLFKYRTKYAYYDHGIAAGVLTAIYYNRKKYLCAKLTSKGIPVPGNHDIGGEAVMEEAIYAILVHNIYNDVYGRISGNHPRHTLLSNPLSYYGMFCDNLQVWDRNKGLDFGLVNWTGSTLYGEDISICFEDTKLRVICRTHDIVESFRKLKDSLEKYLIGSSRLINLNLLENG